MRPRKMSLRAAMPLLVAALLGGCASVEPHLAPAPAVFKDARLDLERATPPSLRTTRLPVFFATTRRASDVPEHFADAPADGVALGVADVRLGDPGWSWEQLIESDLRSTVAAPRSGAVESIKVLGAAGKDESLTDADRAFIAAIDARLARIGNDDVVVYVHGYRVNFNEVAVQMASFAHFLGNAAVVTFQWPTGMMFWNYVTDCPRAQAYIPDIERLLALVARTRARFVNVMAYSCGSPLLGAALQRLRARHPTLGPEALQQRYRIGNVMFVASDVDLKTFAREHMEPAIDLSRQVIVYFSRLDRALGFSSLIAGASRLGQPKIADLSQDDIRRLAGNPKFHAIDVTDVRGAHEMGGMKGHGYWYANDIISTDIMLSLRYPIPPENRCLANVPGTRVWRIPDGYVACVAGKLIELYPPLRR